MVWSIKNTEIFYIYALYLYPQSPYSPSKFRLTILRVAKPHMAKGYQYQSQKLQNTAETSNNSDISGKKKLQVGGKREITLHLQFPILLLLNCALYA